MNRAESSAGLLGPRIALLHLCALVVLRLLVLPFLGFL